MAQQGDDRGSYSCSVRGKKQHGAVPHVWEQQPAGSRRSNSALQCTEGRDGNRASLLPHKKTEPGCPWNGGEHGGKWKEADACGLPLKHSHVESQGRSSTAQECSTAPKRVLTSSDVPEDVTDIQGLLSWINDVARAVEVPHENPSNPAPGCFIAELPDNPRDSRELCMEAQAATGMPTNPFWGLPPSPGFLSELQSGLSQLHPVVPSASAWLSPLPTSLAVTTPSLVQTAQPIEEVQQREPQVAQAHSPLSPGSVPSRMAEKKGSTKWAKRPEPAGNTQKGESSQQE